METAGRPAARFAPMDPGRRLSTVALCLVLAACASTGPSSHWEKEGGTEAGFASDNFSCGAQAGQRTPPSSGLSRSAGPGATAPRNTMNTPPRIDANPVRQRLYMECMQQRGWRVVNG